jgi:penicillin-binding protein 2
MLIFDQLRKNDASLRLTAVGLLAGISLLLAGVMYLQVFSSHRYVESQKNQSLRSVRIPSLRGKITDGRGEVMAENRPSYRLVLYLEELRDKFQAEFSQARGRRKLNRAERDDLGRQTRFQVVSEIVTQMGTLLGQPLQISAKEFYKHYSESLLLPMPILEDLTPKQIAVFEEFPNKPPGVNLEIQPLRFYPHKSMGCHILGYIGRARSLSDETDQEFNYPLMTTAYEGLVGVEGAFDSALRGKAGGKFVMVNYLGYRQSENIWTPAEPGLSLRLTIDARVQKAAEKALQSAQAEVRGAVVVMDCNNGDILALVSAPAYDPNEFVPRISQEDWEKLNDPENLPILNRATYGAYAPGSIFKIIVGLAALEARVLNPTETFQNPGYYQLGRRVIHDEAPPGTYEFRRAFKLSSNTYFIYYGLKAGLASLMNMGQQFHLGERLGVPLRQESKGFFPHDSHLRQRQAEGNPWMEGDTANLCIGQGDITVTPLQMAVMTSAIANGGKLYRPRLIQSLEPQAGSLAEDGPSFPAGQLWSELNVSSHSLEIIRNAMLADVEDSDGTGRRAAVPGYRICGKTGTAQVKKGGHLVRHDTWFVSYAPFENPRYAVVVLVEGGNYGSTTCAPVARQIYQVLQQINNFNPNTPTQLAQE